jgi:hypothetical protein
LTLNLVSMLIALGGGMWWPLMLTVASASTVAAAGLIGFYLYRDMAGKHTPPGATAHEETAHREPHPGPTGAEPGHREHQPSKGEIYPVLDVRRLVPEQPAKTSDPLDNKAWVNLVGECVELFDEMDGVTASSSDPRKDLAEHVCYRLREILERSGVEVLEGDSSTQFDGLQHQLGGKATRTPEGTQITGTLSPGFRIGRRVFRRARVTIN